MRKKVVQKTKGGVNMTEERRKEIKEIVVNLQQMSRESLILVKNAADVIVGWNAKSVANAVRNYAIYQSL